MKFDVRVTTKIRPDFRRKLKKSGKYHLRIFVYKSRLENKYYSTNILVSEDEWEKLNSPNVHPSVRLKKNEIIEIEARAIQIIKELGDYFNFDDFEEMMFGKSRRTKYDNRDVYDTYQLKIDSLFSEGRVGSAIAYERSRDSLKTYRKRLKFEDVSVEFLKGYDRFMRYKNCNQATIGIYLRHFRAIVNMAKAIGVIRSVDYPFGRHSNNKYEIPAGKGTKRALRLDELEQIIWYEPDPNEAWARDMWLLSFYCNGMNMIDIFNLKWGNIKDGFLYFIREKTKLTSRVQTPIEIYLTEEAVAIIERWAIGNSRNKDDYIFGVLDDTMDALDKNKANIIAIRIVNDNMKRIAQKLNLDNKSVSTYVARHTWATILMKNNISLPYISKGLGHTSITTTERYLADFDQYQKIEVGNLLSKIGKNKPEE